MSFGLAWVGLLAAAAWSAPQGASADDCSARAQGAGFPRVLRAGLVAPAMLAVVVQDAEVVAGAHADTLASVRHVQRASRPAWENALQHPENIESMEYAVHQTIATMAAVSGCLSALQGDRAPALPPARYASPVSKRPPAAPELR